MTSEEIIRVANLTIELFGKHHRMTALEKEPEQFLLDTYYERYGMKEEDISDAMWYELAERIR